MPRFRLGNVHSHPTTPFDRSSSNVTAKNLLAWRLGNGRCNFSLMVQNKTSRLRLQNQINEGDGARTGDLSRAESMIVWVASLATQAMMEICN